MTTKEERKNVDEELVALLLSFPEKQAAAILKIIFRTCPNQNK